MHVSDCLNALAVQRIIWIDDQHKQTPEQLARLLCNHAEEAAECCFAELKEIEPLLLEGGHDDHVNEELCQILHGVSQQRLEEISERFAELRRKKGDTGAELPRSVVETLCGLLKVSSQDRWSFTDADEKLAELCGKDENISYIIDLKDEAGDPLRGLYILKQLAELNSQGTSFLLTHERDVDGEADLEQELRGTLAGDSETDNIAVPICAIAKERFFGCADDEQKILGHLRVAIKRAGLRRSVHEILRDAQAQISSAFQVAAGKLLEIPPEHLDRYVVERGYKEGVSELHVLERALTAQMGANLRTYFATSERIHSNSSRVRILRSIELSSAPDGPHRNLEEFRRYEVWEDAELINSACASIACGDVFEFEKDELGLGADAKSRRFMLLGQPCDLAIRSKGVRQESYGFLVPLQPKGVLDEASVVKQKGKEKEPLLPFVIDGQYWVCDFRNTTSVSLGILDLASLRRDGSVRFENHQKAESHYLPSLGIIFSQRRDEYLKLIDQCVKGSENPPEAGLLRLTMSMGRPFNRIAVGQYRKGEVKRSHGKETVSYDRISWGLKRCGRIRMPYAAAMLNKYGSVISREAFEVDFLEEPK